MVLLLRSVVARDDSGPLGKVLHLLNESLLRSFYQPEQSDNLFLQLFVSRQTYRLLL